jgi:diphthamide synthase (EF-2-diphthine--ammonia ligase)
MKRVLLSWSSGKDSAWALHLLRHDPAIEVCALVTTLNAEFDRVAMHGTRHSVLEAQARAAGLPLWIVPLPWPCSNEIYEQRMAKVCTRAVAEKIDAVAFGDLFLADVRSYRENQLKDTGLEPLFPLWQIPTDQLAREMIAGGLRARLSCVDSKQLPAAFAGREFDGSSAPDRACATWRSPTCRRPHPPHRLDALRHLDGLAAGLVQIGPVTRAHAGHQRAAKRAALFGREHFDRVAVDARLNLAATAAARAAAAQPDAADRNAQLGEQRERVFSE